MKTLCRQTVIFLLPFFLIYCLTYTISPSLAFAGGRITTYTPETEEPEPKPELKEEFVKPVEKGGVSWLWIILGVVAVGGIAAAAGGGGSSSGGGGGGGGGESGSLTVGW